MQATVSKIDLGKLNARLMDIRGAKSKVAKELNCSIQWVDRVMTGKVQGEAKYKVINMVVDVIEAHNKSLEEKEALAVKVVALLN